MLTPRLRKCAAKQTHITTKLARTIRVTTGLGAQTPLVMKPGAIIKGDTLTGVRDSFGNITYRDNSGKIRGQEDSFGNKSWSGKNGKVIKGRTDSFGNTGYRDSSGNTIRCYKDSFGTETCN